MIKHLWSAATLAFLVGATAPAQAQEADDAWKVSLTPYLWITSYSGEVAGRPNAPPRETTADFGDILSNLSGAFIGKGEVQYKQVGAYVDVLYLKLSSDNVRDVGRVPLNTEAELSTATTTASLFYRIYDSPGLSVDLLGGLRYVKVELEVDVAAAGGAGVSRDASASVTTPIVGVRATPRLGRRSTLTAYADYGGFESDNATVWQVYGTYNYQWSRHIVTSIGYRHYAIEIDKGPIDADITLSGPLVAFTYQF